jgi:hypothetical protein
MPRPVNPFVQISKRLASLQAKSVKINEELNALASLVAAEAQKQEAAAPAEAKAAPAKKAQPKTSAKATKPKAQAAKPSADPTAAPKKRGRPSKK